MSKIHTSQIGSVAEEIGRAKDKSGEEFQAALYCIMLASLKTVVNLPETSMVQSSNLDEFFEVLTLAQTDKMPRYPIILLNSAYWKPLLEWINHKALPQGFIDAGDEKLFFVVDEICVAVEIIQRYHGQLKS